MKNLLVMLSVVAAVSCNAQPSVDKPGTKKLKLVWSDEFDKPGSPDSTKWNYDLGNGCPGNCYWGNNELQYYTNEKKNVRVEGGNLILEAHKEKRGDREYTSTRIISKN